MKIRYSGQIGEEGLSMDGQIVEEGGVLFTLPLTETSLNSAFYISADFPGIGESLNRGLYVVRVKDNTNNIYRGQGNLIWDGVKEISILDLDNSSFTREEIMQIRDALGIDGDKMVAREGQLQKKSEYPYNEIIDTTKI